MSKRTLTAAMAAVMASGVVTPVFADTNVAELHKAAFEAMQKAEAEKTQLSINQARQALKAFADVMPEHADITTWSTALDHVQQPIFSDIVERLLNLQKEGTEVTQDAVNKVYELIFNGQDSTEDDIPDEYKSGAQFGWTQQTDQQQQKLNDSTIKAYTDAKKAVAEAKTIEEVEAAKKLLKDAETKVASLKTAYNKDASNAGTELEKLVKVETETVTKKEEQIQEELNKYPIKVTGIKAIDESSITVKFTELTAAVENVTLEILDNNGKAVGVEQVKVIDQGETEKQFVFIKLLNSAPTGVWTVNGVKINLDEINLLKTLNEKLLVLPPNHEEIYKLLKESTLVGNLLDINSEAYLKELQEKIDAESTLADVQKVIDETNKNEESKHQISYLVKVATTGTDTQFKNALNELKFERVNADWMSEYKEKIKSETPKTFIEVQTKIDDKNKELVGNKVTEAKILETIKEALKLNEAYMLEDEQNTKANNAKTLNTKLAILKVKEAQTKASLDTALKNLSDVVNDKSKFSYNDTVNEYLSDGYKDAIEGAKAQLDLGVIDDNVSAIKTALEKVASDKRKEILGKIVPLKAQAKNNAEEILKHFEELEKVTAKEAVKFDSSVVRVQLMEKYFADASLVAFSDATDIKTINGAIAKVNGELVKTALENINSAGLMAKLRDEELGVKEYLVDGNDAAYMLEADNTGAPKKNGLFNNCTTIEEVISVIEKVNLKEKIRVSKDVKVVKEELLSYAFKADNAILNKFIDLRDTQREDVARLVIKESIASKKLSEFDNDIQTIMTNRSTIMDNLSKDKLEVTDAIAELDKISDEFVAEKDYRVRAEWAQAFIDGRTMEVVEDQKVAVGLNCFDDVRALLNKVKPQ